MAHSGSAHPLSVAVQQVPACTAVQTGAAGEQAPDGVLPTVPQLATQLTSGTVSAPLRQVVVPAGPKGPLPTALLMSPLEGIRRSPNIAATRYPASKTILIGVAARSAADLLGRRPAVGTSFPGRNSLAQSAPATSTNAATRPSGAGASPGGSASMGAGGADGTTSAITTSGVPIPPGKEMRPCLPGSSGREPGQTLGAEALPAGTPRPLRRPAPDRRPRGHPAARRTIRDRFDGLAENHGLRRVGGPNSVNEPDLCLTALVPDAKLATPVRLVVYGPTRVVPETGRVVASQGSALSPR